MKWRAFSDVAFVIVLIAASPARGAAPRLVSSAPAGYKIINLATDFIAYHDACKALGEAERAAQWTALLEARHPDFFSQVLYRKKEGADRERFKQWCVQTFWTEVAPKMDAIRRTNAAIEREITDTVGRVQKQFPDFRPATDFYVTVSFSFKGKVVGVNGRDVLAIGVEHFEAGQPQLPITIAHELFHLYHFQTFDAGGGLYRTLWAEGLASYASSVVVPGHRFSTYLGFPGEKMNRCQELLPRMARELKAQMGQNDQRIKRIYFGAEPNDTPIPPEAGYYVGFLLAEHLARGRPLADLARMKPNDAFPLIAGELTRLAGDQP